MNPLISRIKELRKELVVYSREEELNYNLMYNYYDGDQAPPSYNQFYTNVKRFITAIERLNNPELIKRVSKLNLNLESDKEIYELEADLVCIFDVIDDILYEQNEQLLVTFNAKSKNKLIGLIVDCLYNESATILPTICIGYGLKEGTEEESYKSKKKYIYSRISFFNEKQIWDLSKKLEGKCDELDKFIFSIENGDHLKLEAKFENIQQRIIEEIDKAEFLIWIAVAWFTDREIAIKLREKKKQGIDIQIIVIDDKINNRVAEKIYQYFNVLKILPTEKFQNIMHHKFCLIDLKKVIHGSYNWSIKAQYNKETISIIENRTQAEKFAREFINIKLSMSED